MSVRTPTHTLTGRALDYAVAITLGGTVSRTQAGYVVEIPGGYSGTLEAWQPSTSGAQGVAILERYRLALSPPSIEGGSWLASRFVVAEHRSVQHLGATLLQAAMRCLVASHNGETTQLPEGMTP